MVMEADRRKAESWRSDRLKDGIEEFRQCLDRHQLRGFFHWAPVSSLLSILVYGIRSPSELVRLDIPHARRGFGSAEKQAWLAHYCYLMVSPYLGLVLERGIDKYALIEVEPAAAWIRGALYVPGNSASASMKLNEMAARSTLEHFEALFPTRDSRSPSDYQVEILVPQSISPQLIKRVICALPNVAERVRKACAERLLEMPNPPTIEESTVFWNLRQIGAPRPTD